MFIRDRVILPPELLVKLHFDSPVLQTVPTFRARKPETGYTALGLQGCQIRASKWANSEYRTHESIEFYYIRAREVEGKRSGGHSGEHPRSFDRGFASAKPGGASSSRPFTT